MVTDPICIRICARERVCGNSLKGSIEFVNLDPVVARLSADFSRNIAHSEIIANRVISILGMVWLVLEVEILSREQVNSSSYLGGQTWCSRVIVIPNEGLAIHPSRRAIFNPYVNNLTSKFNMRPMIDSSIHSELVESGYQRALLHKFICSWHPLKSISINMNCWKQCIISFGVCV